MAGKPKDPAKVRKNTLRVRLTEEERKLVDEAARRNGQETSTWVRAEILALARAMLSKKPH